MVDQMGAQARRSRAGNRLRLGRVRRIRRGERGLKVTGLTISREQHDYARTRIAKAGLSDRSSSSCRITATSAAIYDGIASIEMFEAVGERYWPVYFDTLRERLRPGGRPRCR